MEEITAARVAENVKHAFDHQNKTTLLVGAGISKSAGIGLALDFIKKIKREFPHAHKAAQDDCKNGEQPDYQQCMAKLTRAEQADLIRDEIDNAKINWAHIGIARLEHAQIVDTILTTNFDPLVSRACSLFNRFPAVYDLAGIRDDHRAKIDVDASFVKGSAIFHLHGQHTGFRLLNTRERLEDQAKRIAPVLRETARKGPLIIAGYSGENDPLVDKIAVLAPFTHGLFWICHNDQDPPKEIRDKLLGQQDCCFVRNQPADKFFTILADGTDADPPIFLARPFGHMLDILGTLQDKLGDEPESTRQLLSLAKASVSRAESAQKSDNPKYADIASLMAQGNYQEVWDTHGDDLTDKTDDETELIAWAAIMIGSALSAQARTKEGEEANDLFTQSGEKYAAAFEIKPDKYEALYNWGNALSAQARTKEGEEADGLFAEAGEKHAVALEIKPDSHEALYNWGNALTAQARTKEGEEADSLFTQAGEKYAAAFEIKPDKHEALNNWGNALLAQAKAKEGEEADSLFTQAGEKFAAALEIKPDDHETLYNWGYALSAHAITKEDEEADSLFTQSGEKYAAAFEIKPDKYEALYNWGNALSAQARTKEGEEADSLFTQAGEKFAAALEIKPDDHETLYNWGIALTAQARTKEGEEADDFFAAAGEKYAATLEIKPDIYEALNNWGNALTAQARTKEGEEADDFFAAAGEKYAATLEIKPDIYEALNNWGIALTAQARTKEGEEADSLFTQAGEKFAAALEIKPDDHETLYNWGYALSAHAITKEDEEADSLLTEASGKYSAALEIEPGYPPALAGLAAVARLRGLSPPPTHN